MGAKALEVVKETLIDVRRGKRVGAALKFNVANRLQKTMEQHGLISPSDDQEGSGKRRSYKKKSHKKKKVTATKPKKSINKRKSIKKRINKKKSVKNHRKSFRDIFS